MSDKELAVAIAIIGAIFAGVLADLGYSWTATSCFVIAFGAVLYCAPEI